MPKSRQDPDDRHVQIRTFGVTFQRGYPPHFSVPARASEWHKLIYATRGVLTVETGQGAWVVPPHRAVWIRAGVDFEVKTSGVVALRFLYIRPGARLPREACTVVNVTPLLRELIVRAVMIGALDTRIVEQKRLMGVIFDELRVLHAMPLQLPLPRDPRAARFAALAGRPTKEMLRGSGASRRTLERIFRAETDMSLGQWLRRQALLHALRRLAAGEGVNAVALELGYNGASAFIAMFRRELGQTPREYFRSAT